MPVPYFKPETKAKRQPKAVPAKAIVQMKLQAKATPLMKAPAKAQDQPDQGNPAPVNPPKKRGRKSKPEEIINWCKHPCCGRNAYLDVTNFHGGCCGLCKDHEKIWRNFDFGYTDDVMIQHGKLCTGPKQPIESFEPEWVREKMWELQDCDAYGTKKHNRRQRPGDEHYDVSCSASSWDGPGGRHGRP